MTAPAPALISAESAAHMLSSAAAPLIIDARPPALHTLERLRGAVSPPSPTALSRVCANVALVYDSGTSTLTPPFVTPAARQVYLLHPHAPPHLTLTLVVGGLPALRAAAPHHVVAMSAHPALPHVPKQLAHFPWAVAAFRAEHARSLPPARILPRLYVGAAPHAADPHWLASHAVTHILAVGDEFLKPPPTSRLVAWRRLPVRDSKQQNILHYFHSAVEFVDDALRSTDSVVLVHCMAGASRSIATVAAFLVWRGWDAADALAYIRSLRPAADPNSSFVTQLYQWEQRCIAVRQLDQQLQRNLHPRRPRWEEPYEHVDSQHVTTSSPRMSFDDLPSSPMTPVTSGGGNRPVRPLDDWLGRNTAAPCLLPPPALDFSSHYACEDDSNDDDDLDSIVSDDMEAVTAVADVVE